MNSTSTPALAADAFSGTHLGVPVFRLTDPSRLDELAQSLPVGLEGPVLIETRVAASDVTRMAEVAASGFRLVDTNVQLDVDAGLLRDRPASPLAGPVRPAVPLDRAGVERVARENLVTSRFHLDPAIDPGRASALKAAWAGNFFDGRRGDQLWVAEHDGAVSGFLQVLDRGERGTIDLVAVDPVLRGTGAAGAMIQAWVRTTPAITRVLVGTQLSNTRSLRAYGRLGFRVCETMHVWHLHAQAANIRETR